jgi:hemerythrin-like metal-binding domain
MAIDFSELRLGIPAMDQEHQDLAALFDSFERCFQTRSDPEKAEALVGEAVSVAMAHFEHEEELMTASGYPGTEEHKFHHRNLRLQFTALLADTLANLRAQDPVTLEHLNQMRRLLVEHIMGPDTALAAHLKAVQG